MSSITKEEDRQDGTWDRRGSLIRHLTVDQAADIAESMGLTLAEYLTRSGW